MIITFMATQMSSARRGIATDEMKQVAKDEDVTLDWLIPKVAKGSIILATSEAVATVFFFLIFLNIIPID